MNESRMIEQTYLLIVAPVWILHYSFGLDKWVVNHLVRAGCKTVEDVRQLVAQPDYYASMRNYGVKSHEKVVAALALHDMEYLQNKKIAELQAKIQQAYQLQRDLEPLSDKPKRTDISGQMLADGTTYHVIDI